MDAKHRTLRRVIATLLLAGGVGATVAGCLLPVPYPADGGHRHHHRRGHW